MKKKKKHLTCLVKMKKTQVLSYVIAKYSFAMINNYLLWLSQDFENVVELYLIPKFVLMNLLFLSILSCLLCTVYRLYTVYKFWQYLTFITFAYSCGQTFACTHGHKCHTFGVFNDFFLFVLGGFRREWLYSMHIYWVYYTRFCGRRLNSF